MKLNQILTDNHFSKYRLSKNSGVPYMTINDICSGKTIYKIAKELRRSKPEKSGDNTEKYVSVPVR